MTITVTDLTWDKNQGIGEQGREFGYVHTGRAEDGGYFFTWLPTMAETLASLDADHEAEPSFDASLAEEFLRSTLSDHFGG